MVEEKFDRDLNRQRWTLYIPLSCVISFVFGSTYALSSFSLSMREYSPTFVAPYISALSVQSFVAAGSLCAGAYYLDAKPHRLRWFTLVGCVALSLQALGAYAVQIQSETLMLWALSVEGLGVGVIYLVGVEHAARWMPDRPGLAMGITMGSMGMGQIFGARCFHGMAVLLGGVVQGLYMTTIVFVIPPAISAMFLQYPPAGWDPRSAETIAALGDAHMGNETGSRLGWRLLKQWEFYCLLWIVAMGAGPSFGILSGFPAVLNGLYGMDPKKASSWFAFMSLVSMITRFTIGVLADHCGFGSGFFWSGGKNLAIILFTLQTLALTFISQFYLAGNLYAVMSCLSLTFMSFAGAGVIAAILCRQMFAPKNAGVVFG